MNKIIIILIIILISGCSHNGIDVELAKCIGENSVIYISTGCSHCERQKDMFGSSFKELNSVDCAFESEKGNKDRVRKS